MIPPDGFRSHFRKLGLAYLVLVVSLALSISASVLLHQSIRARQRERFRATSEVVFDTSAHDLAYFLLLLQGVRGLFVESIPEPAMVRAYFKSIHITDLQEKESLQGVGLIWRVTPKNEQEFLEYFRKHHLTNVVEHW